jgi:hypothetical protein
VLSEKAAVGGEIFHESYLECTEAVKLFRFILLPDSLIRTFSRNELFADRQRWGITWIYVRVLM